MGKMWLSAYEPDLQGLERVHYEITVELCGNINSYDFSGNEAVCDAKLYSHIEFTDIKDYPVHGTSFATRDELKAYKSMQAHNYATSGRAATATDKRPRRWLPLRRRKRNVLVLHIPCAQCSNEFVLSPR